MNVSGAPPMRRFLLLCERHKLCTFLHVRRKRLFGEHMLAVLQRGFRHAIVLIRTGKVQNNLHFGIVERFIHILINFRPVSYLGAIILCAVIFYRRKLKRPIEILNAASAKIAENDLGFTVEVPCGNELGRLCESFEKMRASLLTLNREHWAQMEERRRLNAAFAHDLRTPLTVLRGRASLLEAELTPDSEAAADLKVMKAHIERLVRYADAMSSLQRMEDVEVRREPVELAVLAESLRETAETLFPGREVHVSQNGGKAMVDAEVVMQVCGNILSNSARYARRRVEIELLLVNGALRVAVTDDGGGFTREGLEKAASPFYKGEGSGSEHLGLGLNICDILCRRHGGRLVIENAGAGARVTAVFGVE